MSSTNSISERLENTHRQLNELQRRLQRGSRITLIVSLVLLAIIASYFTFGYFEIRDLIQPKHLVDLVGNRLDDQIPQLRQTIEKQITDSAPAWAEQLSEQLVAAAPSLRQSLENYSLKQTKALVDHLTTVSEDQFRRLLKEQRPAIESALRDLDKDDDLSDDVLAVLEDGLRNTLSADLRTQSQQLLETLHGMRTKLVRLRDGENLNREEQLERQVLMIVRRLQQEQLEKQKAQAEQASEEEEAEEEAEEPESENAPDQT